MPFLNEHKRPVSSVFYGGGTPSLANPKFMEYINSAILKWNEKLHYDKRIEITMEANPTSIENNKLKDFQQAGINRLSIGVQSLDDDELKFLGRAHTAKDALEAIHLAQNLFGQENISIDLMFGTQKHAQQSNHWSKILKKALDIGTHHISLYQLTIEKKTKFYEAFHSGQFILPKEDQSAELYDQTISMSKEYGLLQYEVSNFAVPGKECQHNLQYWKYRDYFGIGCGAHGRITDMKTNEKRATIQIPSVKEWIHNIQELKQDGNKSNVLLHSEDRVKELTLMGLRLPNNGISLADLRFHSNNPETTFEDYFSLPQIQLLEKANYVQFTNNTLSITQQGIRFLNQILPRLLK